MRKSRRCQRVAIAPATERQPAIERVHEAELPTCTVAAAAGWPAAESVRRAVRQQAEHIPALEAELAALSACCHPAGSEVHGTLSECAVRPGGWGAA